MKIKVKFISPLSDLTGKKEDLIELFDGATVSDVLGVLTTEHGKEFEEYVLNLETHEIQPYIQVMVNARNIGSLNGLKTKLNDSDIIRLFPPVSGG